MVTLFLKSLTCIIRLSSFPPGGRYITTEVEIRSLQKFQGGQSAHLIYSLPQGMDPLRHSHQGGTYGTNR